jgi:hypothetical protein
MAEKFYSIATLELKPVWYDCKVELDEQPTPEQMTDMKNILREDYDFEVLSLYLEYTKKVLSIQIKILTYSMSTVEFNAIVDGLLGQVGIFYDERDISDVGKVKHGFSKVYR